MWQMGAVSCHTLIANSQSTDAETLRESLAFVFHFLSKWLWQMLKFNSHCNSCSTLKQKRKSTTLWVALLFTSLASATKPRKAPPLNTRQRAPSTCQRRRHQALNPDKQVTHTTVVLADAVLQLTWSGLIHERMWIMRQSGHGCRRKENGEWAICIPHPLPNKLFCHRSGTTVPCPPRINQNTPIPEGQPGHATMDTNMIFLNEASTFKFLVIDRLLWIKESPQNCAFLPFSTTWNTSNASEHTTTPSGAC